ncbi:bae5bbc5-d414-463d-b882-f866e391ec8e [Thermothielavioides terrestris]|uniref:Bae5bbc5-d414-463d-b882-f866e391ec8e n=1 Tax=Thermothielavioides terrestris TaxID=2587410 RepID=A0A3S4F7W5_9PEZI|nr:bae5bbc5-d414-463d-b882-f866e391ec8e [Thermothielavioides terrestris]
MSSLLMRRKTAQAVGETELPVPSYDPRIRGTRVHDFSAPRPKKAVSSDGTTSTVTVNTSVGGGASSAGPTPTSSGPDRSTELEDQGRDTQVRRTTSLGDDRPEQPPPQVPPKDESGSSLRTSSSAASKGMPVASLPSLASASVRTTASRQLSLSGTSRRDSVASAVPKHMKSTSSRFSFDMIGAAKQEKLLEERHRQREQEKKPLDDQRHSDERFEDFDEDFDYDAMMDDDGLEERIPGVNADYDDEEDLEAAMDPDNDQENFAGFVFQRSNPASSLATPHTPAMLATPRDANGRVIGFAMTKDTTPELPSADSPNQSAAAPSTQPPPQALNDDLYFDDGLADELDFEHDGTVFDESIFDNQDTDQFGRPIPGAFAQAKEAMMAAQQQQQAGKRDSDRTSSASAQSAAVLSTGHTSLSAGPQPLPCHQENAERLSKPASAEPVPLANIPSQELAYQAALAEAAQKAAASGKFRRSSSPDVLAGISSTHTTDAAGPDDADKDAYLDDYDDNDNAFENDFDDFDFDDEAIIAEANASALANDSDGFYGQEFGFYSAPIPHHPAHAHSHASSSASSSGVFTTESLFQYANGGYFGPVALNRSTSGRVVSREPNLTPITERSEYSNRNSIMSFTLPPAIGSAASDGRNSALAMSSPGLAQLALMSASGDDADGTMSLSALMKLRSKAWGGSQASLASSSREGSPRSERATPLDGPAGAGAAAAAASTSSSAAAAASPYGTVPAHLAGHVRVNSGLSLWSCFEDAAEEDDGDSGGGGGAGGGTSLAAGAAGDRAGRGRAGSASGRASGAASPASLPTVLPARPGSAGGALGGAPPPPNGVVLPQRPHSLFLPPQAPLSVASSQGQQQQQQQQQLAGGGGGGSACSPVLEGEEAEAEEASAGAGTGAGRFALAPALPIAPATTATGLPA